MDELGKMIERIRQHPRGGLSPLVAKELEKWGITPEMLGMQVVEPASVPKGQLASVHLKVEDLPEPYVPSELERCSKCDARIWVSTTTPAECRKFCVKCAGEEMDAEGMEA